MTSGPDDALCLDLPALEALFEHPFSRVRWEAVTDTHFHLRIGNAHATTRREQSLDQLEWLFSQVECFGHGFCEVWRRRESIYAEIDLLVPGTRGTGIMASLPCVIVARLIRGRLADLRFYVHLDPPRRDPEA